MRVRKKGEAGFTLVEVLVAFVASALLLAVIFDGMSVARERSRMATDRAVALALAHEILSAKLAGDEIASAGTRGSKLNWKIETRVLGRDPRGTLELREQRVVVVGPREMELARLEGRALVRSSP